MKYVSAESLRRCQIKISMLLSMHTHKFMQKVASIDLYSCTRSSATLGISTETFSRGTGCSFSPWMLSYSGYPAIPACLCRTSTGPSARSAQHSVQYGGSSEETEIRSKATVWLMGRLPPVAPLLATAWKVDSA
eukprot:Rmarinus@m.22445